MYVAIEQEDCQTFNSGNDVQPKICVRIDAV